MCEPLELCSWRLLVRLEHQKPWSAGLPDGHLDSERQSRTYQFPGKSRDEITDLCLDEPMLKARAQVELGRTARGNNPYLSPWIPSNFRLTSLGVVRTPCPGITLSPLHNILLLNASASTNSLIGSCRTSVSISEWLVRLVSTLPVSRKATWPDWLFLHKLGFRESKGCQLDWECV